MTMLFNHNAIEITIEELSDMYGSWENDKTSAPYRLFWCFDDGIYIVIDNESGDFFIENFKNQEAAHAWLRGVDTDICYKIDKMLA